MIKYESDQALERIAENEAGRLPPVKQPQWPRSSKQQLEQSSLPGKRDFSSKC